MDIFDVYTPEALAELSLDDPRQAFVDVSRRCVALLEQRLQESSDNNWGNSDHERHDFVNIIVATARRLEIEPFDKYQMPKVSQFSYDTYLDFRAELDHYLTQIVLDNTIRAGRNAVAIPEKSRDRIRTYLNALRKCVDDADITDAKRATFHKLIGQFEQELIDKKRISLAAAALLSFTVLGIPGNLWTSEER